MLALGRYVFLRLTNNTELDNWPNSDDIIFLYFILAPKVLNSLELFFSLIVLILRWCLSCNDSNRTNRATFYMYYVATCWNKHLQCVLVETDLAAY